MINDRVNDILRDQASKEDAASKAIHVEKEIPVSFDLGHLLVSDTNLLDKKFFKTHVNDQLLKLTRDNTQLFINQLWQQETETVDGFVIARLPAPKTILPRAKRVPKPRQPTKWEAFAKKKGIKQKTKEKLVWDEESKEWKPRYGLKSNKNEQDRNLWLVEDKPGQDPQELFGKSKHEKKERIAKNEFNRLKNIARNSGKRASGINVTNMEILNDPQKHGTKDLERAAILAKSSTASLGKFQEAANNEKPVKGTGGKKRKFDSNEGNIKEEKDKYLKLVDEVLREKPKLNVKKAVTNYEISEQKKNHDKKKTSAKLPGKKGRPSKDRQFSGKKGKLTKGRK